MANTLNLFRNGAVVFIDWLGEFRGEEPTRWTEINERNDEAVQGKPNVNQQLIPAANNIKWVERLCCCESEKHEQKDQARAAPEKKQANDSPQKQDRTDYHEPDKQRLRHWNGMTEDLVKLQNDVCRCASARKRSGHFDD